LGAKQKVEGRKMKVFEQSEFFHLAESLVVLSKDFFNKELFDSFLRKKRMEKIGSSKEQDKYFPNPAFLLK
jgi:hypothetical protein